MGNECGMTDTRDLEEGQGARNEKLLNGYNVHLSDDHTKNPDFTTMQDIHITKLHLLPLNSYTFFKRFFIHFKACMSLIDILFT